MQLSLCPDLLCHRNVARGQATGTAAVDTHCCLPLDCGYIDSGNTKKTVSSDSHPSSAIGHAKRDFWEFDENFWWLVLYLHYLPPIRHVRVARHIRQNPSPLDSY